MAIRHILRIDALRCLAIKHGCKVSELQVPGIAAEGVIPWRQAWLDGQHRELMILLESDEYNSAVPREPAPPRLKERRRLAVLRYLFEVGGLQSVGGIREFIYLPCGRQVHIGTDRLIREALVEWVLHLGLYKYTDSTGLVIPMTTELEMMYDKWNEAITDDLLQLTSGRLSARREGCEESLVKVGRLDHALQRASSSGFKQTLEDVIGKPGEDRVDPINALW